MVRVGLLKRCSVKSCPARQLSSTEVGSSVLSFFMSCFLHHCRSKTKRCCELNWGALKLNDSIEEIVWRWRGVLKKMAIGFGVWGK